MKTQIENVYSRKYKDKPVVCEVCGKVCRGKWWHDSHMLTHSNERNFKCLECEMSFKSLNNLQSHIRSQHLKEKLFNCDYCCKSFQEKRTLVLHINAKHTNNRSFVCNQTENCNRSFVSRYQLKKHQLNHSDIQPKKDEPKTVLFEFKLKEFLTEYDPDDIIEYDGIEECLERVIVQAEEKESEDVISEGVLLDVPIQDSIITKQQRSYKTQKISEVSNSCLYCKLSFNDDNSLFDHVNEAHAIERPHVCEICNYRFKVKSKLKRHSVIHTQDKKYKCEICGWAFIQNYTLKKHMEVHQNTDIMKYNCRTCNKTFRSNMSLQSHLYTHIKEQEEETTVKIVEYENLEQLKEQSMIDLQNDIETEEFSCSQCNFVTFTKSSFTIHMRKCHSITINSTTEQQNQDVQCTQCSTVMKHKYMKRHVLDNHGDIKHRCPECKMLFNLLKSLLRHCQTVHGEKGHQVHCTLCNKSFPTQISLENHSKTHNMESFTCLLCNVSLKGRPSYNRHMARHQSLKKVPCLHANCKDMFYDKFAMKTHFIRYHSKNMKS